MYEVLNAQQKFYGKLKEAILQESENDPFLQAKLTASPTKVESPGKTPGRLGEKD